jgi:hypothetical protein
VLAYDRRGLVRDLTDQTRALVTYTSGRWRRVRRRDGLRVLGPARRPRCPERRDAKIKAEGVNDVWCVDLVFDSTRHGVTLKFLTIVDEGSHYCIDIAVGRRMTARDVVRRSVQAVTGFDFPRAVVELGQVNIKDKKTIEAKITCSNNEEYRSALGEAVGESVIILMVDSETFMSARGEPQIDKDQLGLDLDGEE